MTQGIWLIFMREVGSLKICTLMGSFCPKHIKLDERVQESYVSWHWRMMQSLKKNDMRNLVNFNASSGKSGNLHFDVLLLSKVYYVWAKKSTQKSCVITLKNDAKFEGELTCALLNDMRNLVNFDSTLKILKICTIMGSFWAKYIMFGLKKYRGVMVDGFADWYKIWRKNDLCFQKWHEELEKFSPEHLKVSKLGLWWHPFIQSRR